MRSPAPRLCEDCANHCFATSNNRTTCSKKRRQRYVWPEKLGDPHGPAPRQGSCFEVRAAAPTDVKGGR